MFAKKSGVFGLPSISIKSPFIPGIKILLLNFIFFIKVYGISPSATVKPPTMNDLQINLFSSISTVLLKSLKINLKNLKKIRIYVAVPVIIAFLIALFFIIINENIIRAMIIK